MRLKTKGPWFIDNDNRKVLLRGVNLGGSTKIPVEPNGVTHIKSDFSDHRDVSFVGRPFPIEEAHEHFERLKHWGFNCLRLLTVWEAIEHKGPGEYDQGYLDYFKEIVEIAGEYDFYIFVDPHQDVWSRMTGGDGAPGWTFEKVGLDFTTFANNAAAKVMQYHYPENYKEMEWSFNWRRFGTATMFTLFFGSEAFAPNAKIDGISVQSYLQDHFINAMKQIALKIKDYEHVIGFDSLNEPSNGFIGIENLNKFPDFTPPGLNFTPFDAMVSGSGVPREAKIYDLKLIWLRQVGTQIMNPNEISSWINDENDIWRNHGIWEKKEGKAILRKPEYFKFNPDGSKVNFFEDYLRPFIVKYTREIREVIPDSLIFVEGDPQDPVIHWVDNNPQGIVNASHWYDGYTLYTKTFRPWLTLNIDTGRPVIFSSRVYNYFKQELLKRKKQSMKIHKGIPTLIGEFGIPYDMNDAKAYETGDFSDQINALNIYYNLMDDLKLHSTQWNYTADNNNKWGDLWNMEDLSIFSKDQRDNPDNINSGGRGIRGFCRPYPMRIAGEVQKWDFDLKTSTFTFNYVSNGSDVPSIIYVPTIQYPNGLEISVTPNLSYKYTRSNQFLKIKGKKNMDVKVTIKSI